MQAIILAAGRGNRLSAVTQGLPKSFLQVGGKRIIDRQLDNLRRVGVTDITIVTGYRKALFEETYRNHGIHFAFNPFFETTNVLASFWFGQRFLHDEFLYFHADTIFEPAIFDELIRSPGDVVLPVDTHPCAEEEMKVRVDSSRHVVEINKTMAGRDALGEFIGIARCSRAALTALKEVTEDFMVRQEFHHYFEAALQKLIDDRRGPVSVLDITGKRWNEIDFEADLEKGRRLFEVA
jgi:L-glutamine-phosphate cytidylyltransferase